MSAKAVLSESVYGDNLQNLLTETSVSLNLI